MCAFLSLIAFFSLNFSSNKQKRSLLIDLPNKLILPVSHFLYFKRPKRKTPENCFNVAILNSWTALFRVVLMYVNHCKAVQQTVILFMAVRMNITV